MGPEAALDLTLEGLVHDLNNIFETISDAADLLETDPKWVPVAAAIHRSVNRGRRIVDSYSLSARGEQDLDFILDNSIEFAKDLFRVVQTPSVNFIRDVEPGIHLPGNAGAWERVLLNLFINATQAMKQGGVIEVTAHRKPGAIEISVADSGSGIPTGILPQIFDARFSTKSASSGLGLHIVKTIVSHYGGVVWAANRTGVPGATFCIRLPETLREG